MTSYPDRYMDKGKNEMKQSFTKPVRGIVETVGRNIAVRASHGRDQASKLYIISPLLPIFQDIVKGQEMMQKLKKGMAIKIWVQEGSEYIYNVSLD